MCAEICVGVARGYAMARRRLALVYSCIVYDQADKGHPCSYVSYVSFNTERGLPFLQVI